MPYASQEVGHKPITPGLYVVATPIGNLEDITIRAVRILGEVALVAAEDTRTAGRLLQAHQLQKPLLSLHRDNEAQRSQQIIDRITDGDAVALISDAGTPCISDPGYLLVKQTADAGLPIFPIPGPSAVIAGLSASGLPTQHFVFLGFLPAKEGKRRRTLAPYANLPATLVFYEAPHRILALLDTLIDALGDRDASLGREITKFYEEFLRGTLTQIKEKLASRDAIKGEIVLMVRGAADAQAALLPHEGADGEENKTQEEQLYERAKELLASGKRSTKLARQLTTEYPSLSRKEAYRILEMAKEQREDT